MKTKSKDQKGIKIIYKINNNQKDKEKIDKIRLFGENFYRENNDKCKFILNNKECDLCEFYTLKNNEKELEIELIINQKIKNLNSMFSCCLSLYSISNLSYLNTSEVNDMSFMFYECSNLSSLSDISKWNIKKVKNISFMFYECSLLKKIEGLSNWDTSNIEDMSFMFFGCSSLLTLSDISKWNTPNLIDMNSSFYNCSELEHLPDISKWKITKETNKENTFYNCAINKIDIFQIINSKKQKNNKNKKKVISNDNYSDIISLNNQQLNNNEDYKIFRNDNLSILPQIDIKFEGNFEINNDMIQNLKNELKDIIKNEKFSLIEVKKGSLKILITLQFIYKKVLESIRQNPVYENIENFPNNINKEVIDVANKIKKHKFLFIGKAKPDFIHKSVLDVTTAENQKRLKNLFKSYNDNKKENKINLYEQSKNITLNDLDELIDILSNEADKQEINQFKMNFEEFHDKEKELEQALNDSIFEYKIINIYLIIRENSEYKNSKDQCPNKEVKLLFHGAPPKAIANIMSTNFNCISEVRLIGQGTYFTDNLDYVWFYTGNERRKRCVTIPKVNETFSFIASETYFDKKKEKFEYNTNNRNKVVEENGVRRNKVDGTTTILNMEQINNNKGFIANEFVLSYQKQILPLYIITMKRCEYLIIWRDYNFDLNNPNNYDNEQFKKMVEFNEEIKKFSRREVDSKVYYVKSSEEGLELIKKKKYNKIILITNGNNNAKEYITDARKIIGANCIALVSAFDPSNHIEWVKKFENTLISNREDFHERFIKSVILFDVEELEDLKDDIEDYYGKMYKCNLKFKDFDSDILKYPHFKNNGNFSDLEFQ